MVLELDLEPCSGPSGAVSARSARAEGRAVLLRIENVDRDRTVDKRRVCAREHDQRVYAVKCWTVRDVDEMQRHVRCVVRGAPPPAGGRSSDGAVLLRPASEPIRP